tara:strand:+ start:771 stop:1181 length:411 start_codon:yes stop_codon:yes gene_type:complete
MQHIEIEPTYKSPKVVFNPSDGNFTIEGKSILVNVDEFYAPLLNWMDEFVNQPTTKQVNFTFDVEYFNIASTKRFLFFLFKLLQLKEKGIQINIVWRYVNDDQYGLETGKDFEQMTKLPFEFLGYEKLHSKETKID